VPLLEQYTLLAQFFLNEQVATFRVTCKILYLQLNVFLDLAANGFCVPKHLNLEQDEADGLDEEMEEGGKGLEGTKDVSGKMESEDDKSTNQEQEKQEDKACEEEKKGEDPERSNEDEGQSNGNEEGDEANKEMEETGEGTEQLDKEIWGDDKEQPNDDSQQSENTGEQTGEKELAKNDRDRKGQDDDTENQQEDSKEEINELNEPEVNEDWIDPCHGKFQPEPEPEPFDLPEDLNLDEENNIEDGGETLEENPFDIDEIKDSKPPPRKKDLTFDKEVENNQGNDPAEDSDEKENDEEEKESGEDEKENGEDEKENGEEEEKSGEDEKESGEDEKENGEKMNKERQDTMDENSKENEKEKDGEAMEIEENKEEEKEKQEKMEEDRTMPEMDTENEQADAAQDTEEMTKDSRDAVAQEQCDKNQKQQDASTEDTDKNIDKDNSYGQSQSAQQEKGHLGSPKHEMVSESQRNEAKGTERKRNKLNESNEDRTLLDKYEPVPKKRKTFCTQEEISRDENEDDLGSNSNEAEMVQHVQKDSQKFDDNALEAGTEDQLRKQAASEESEDQEERKEDVIEMHEDEQTDTENNEVTEQRSEKLSKTINEDQSKDTEDDAEEEIDGDVEMKDSIELEGEVIGMPWVQRGNESTLHAMERSEQNDLVCDYVQNKRCELEKTLSKWTQVPSTEKAIAAWNGLCSITDPAARDLSEKLRLVLEPTQASQLKGDYKTGKRINMRKIIPYIASEFRKDKIWLRRTKPSKRDYQVVIAVDDSSSMSDNVSTEMTLESLSLISKAMTYLEVGQLGIISFGEEVKLLHPLEETFTEQSGARFVSVSI